MEKLRSDDAWLDIVLDHDAPFRATAFEAVQVPGPVQRPQRELRKGPKIDLRKLSTDTGKIKYTCPFMRCEFDSSEIKEWWRKPNNKRGLPPVPICPKCDSAGAMLGWGHDWTEVEKENAEWSRKRQAYLDSLVRQRELELKSGSEEDDNGN